MVLILEPKEIKKKGFKAYRLSLSDIHDTYTLHRIWGGKIITLFMGFNNFAMEKVENDVELIINYR